MKKLLSLLLALSLVLPPVANAEGGINYADVTDDAWYATSVATCTAAGLMEGVGGDSFAPDRALTVGECVVLTARLMALQTTGTPNFPVLPDDLNDCVGFFDKSGQQVANFKDVVGLGQNLLVVFEPEATTRLIAGGAETLTMVLDVSTFDWSAFKIHPTAPLRYEGVQIRLDAPPDPAHPYAYSFDIGTDWNSDLQAALNALKSIVDYETENPIPRWYRDALYYVGDRLPTYGYDALAVVKNVEGMSHTATRLDFVLLAASALEKHPLPIRNANATVPDCEDAHVLVFYQAGILSGAGTDGAFYGDLPLTRAQAATILGRIIDPSLRIG